MHDTQTNILIELDCLFDTRAAILSDLYPDLVEEIFADEKYFKRPNDDFTRVHPGIDQATFEERWKNRNIDDLLGSLLTSCRDDLQGLIKEFKLAAVGGVTVPDIKITVNMYPYKLSHALEKRLAYEVQLHTNCDVVETVSLNYDFLRPEYLKGFGTVILYDFNTWLGLHIAQLETTPLYMVKFACPIKLIKLPENPAELSDLILTMKDKLKGGLVYEPLPMGKFCFLDPQK